MKTTKLQHSVGFQWRIAFYYDFLVNHTDHLHHNSDHSSQLITSHMVILYWRWSESFEMLPNFGVKTWFQKIKHRIYIRKTQTKSYIIVYNTKTIEVCVILKVKYVIIILNINIAVNIYLTKYTLTTISWSDLYEILPPIQIHHIILRPCHHF